MKKIRNPVKAYKSFVREKGLLAVLAALGFNLFF